MSRSDLCLTFDLAVVTLKKPERNINCKETRGMRCERRKSDFLEMSLKLICIKWQNEIW